VTDASRRAQAHTGTQTVATIKVHHIFDFSMYAPHHPDAFQSKKLEKMKIHSSGYDCTHASIRQRIGYLHWMEMTQIDAFLTGLPAALKMHNFEGSGIR